MLLGLLALGSLRACHNPTPDFTEASRRATSGGQSGAHSSEPEGIKGGVGGSSGSSGSRSNAAGGVLGPAGAAQGGIGAETSSDPSGGTRFARASGGERNAGGDSAVAEAGSGGYAGVYEGSSGSAGANVSNGDAEGGTASLPEGTEQDWDPSVSRYVLEGDVLFPSAEAVLRFALSSEKPSRLAYAEKRRLTYCLSPEFGDNYDAVRKAMLLAAAAWQANADVAFFHEREHDSNCEASTRDLAFDVLPAPKGASFAIASFYPDFERSERHLFIDWARATSMQPRSLVGLLQHALGHALGFRHEYLNERAKTEDCQAQVDWRVLTDYDSMSVMHYPWCMATSGDFIITRRDAERAMLRYDAAKLVVPADDELILARRLSDGDVFVREGAGYRRLASDARAFTFAEGASFILTRDGHSVRMYTPQQMDGAIVGFGGGQLLDCAGHLCATHDFTGDLFRYSRMTQEWEWLSKPMRRIWSNSTTMFAIDEPSPQLLRLDEQGWMAIGGPVADFCATEGGHYAVSGDNPNLVIVTESGEILGAAGSQLVACSDTVCRLSLDRSSVDRYDPGVGWTTIAGPAGLPLGTEGALTLSGYRHGLLVVEAETGDIYRFDDRSQSWTSLGHP